jgi:hypothetical protein
MPCVSVLLHANEFDIAFIADEVLKTWMIVASLFTAFDKLRSSLKEFVLTKSILYGYFTDEIYWSNATTRLGGTLYEQCQLSA